MTHDRTNESNGHAGRDAELNALLKQLRIEQAPERLTRRLYRIPAEEGDMARGGGWRDWFRAPPRWVLAPAFAAVPVLIHFISRRKARHIARSWRISAI